MKEKIDNKILKAAKWSSITEIIAKLVVPITNMILARILDPDAFGVVATITMIISFADMFTDAGFQKYLIQHEFSCESEKDMSANVAFWTNLCISIFIWIIIIISSKEIAELVGNPGLGNVISIACIQLPMTSFSSIQMAIYRRDFDFKTLFSVRVIGIIIPFIITIPLAILNYSYWSIIIGTICGAFSNALILTIKSKWKPSLKFKFKVLKDMFSFSMWSLIEAISIWLTTWIDTFIIGGILNTYYLGVYKTSLTAVNGIFGLITSATTPILFSALSRVQNNEKEFQNMFFTMQKIIAYIVIPMSVGVFVYSDVVVKILLGNQWNEAESIVGIWALISGFVIVLSHYSSEVYRSKGMPKLSFFSQILHLIVLVPVCIFAAKYSFVKFVNIRALIRLQLVVVNLIFMRFILNISLKKMIGNIYIPIISSIAMGMIGIYLSSLSNKLYWDILSILICMIVYIVLLMCFPMSRNDIYMILDKLKIKKLNKC